MILILRQIADMLWAYKEAHIAVGAVLIFILVKSLLQQGVKDLYQFKICFLIILVISYITAVLQLSYNSYTVLPYMKVVSSILMVCIGIFDKDPQSTIKNATYFSIVIVIVNSIYALSGSGYKNWGDANTYAGLYYFKTDLALAICICMSLIISADWLKKYYKFTLIILCLYLIIISNARAYYVITFLLIVLYIYKNNLGRMIYYLLPVSILSIVLLSYLLQYIPQFFGNDLLSLDLSLNGFYSTENTQGRSEIWEAILDKFLELDFLDQLTGIGLDGDIILTKNTLDNDLSGLSAHNGYLYVLITTGWIGLIIFLTFIYYIIKMILNLVNISKKSESQSIVFLLILHIIIYLVSNISNPNIIFQQESWFFMYFVGCSLKIYHLQKVNLYKKDELTQELHC